METPEIKMLFKNEFTDDQLERYLNRGEIKASEKPDVPPQVLWLVTVRLLHSVISVHLQVRLRVRRLSTSQRW